MRTTVRSGTKRRSGRSAGTPGCATGAPRVAAPQVAALAPESRTAPRAFKLAALALFSIYLACMSGHQASIDGMLMQRQAHALVIDHSVRLRTPVWTWDGNPMRNSQYGIGQSLLFVPGYFVAAPLASLVPVSETRPAKLGHFYYAQAYGDPLYAAGGSWVFAAITALSAYVVSQLALALGASARAALWGMAFYGIGSTALVYSRGDFSQPLAGLCWAAGLLAGLRYRDTGRTALLWTSGAIVAYGILSRPFEGLLLVPAVLLVMVPLRPSQWDRPAVCAALAVGAGVLAAVAVTLLVNFARFGELLHFGYTERARWMIPEAATLAAVFVSPARGILWQFPAIVLVPAAALALVRRGRAQTVAAVALLAGAMLMATACWHVWWGGWCWGLRLFVPALAPLAAVAAVGIDGLQPRARRVLPPLLLLAGFVWALPCVLTDSLAGYAKAHDGAAGAWMVTGFPWYGAWQYLRRLTAIGSLDIYGIDIVWFRIAHMTDGWSLLIPAALLALAMLAAVLARRNLTGDALPPPSPQS
jgi:hypothetical protein